MKHKPGMIPRFMSQPMAQKEAEKKMALTTAKATRRSPKVAWRESHHCRVPQPYVRCIA